MKEGSDPVTDQMRWRRLVYLLPIILGMAGCEVPHRHDVQRNKADEIHALNDVSTSEIYLKEENVEIAALQKTVAEIENLPPEAKEVFAKFAESMKVLGNSGLLEHTAFGQQETSKWKSWLREHHTDLLLLVDAIRNNKALFENDSNTHIHIVFTESTPEAVATVLQATITRQEFVKLLRDIGARTTAQLKGHQDDLLSVLTGSEYSTMDALAAFIQKHEDVQAPQHPEHINDSLLSELNAILAEVKQIQSLSQDQIKDRIPLISTRLQLDQLVLAATPILEQKSLDQVAVIMHFVSDNLDLFEHTSIRAHLEESAIKQKLCTEGSCTHDHIKQYLSKRIADLNGTKVSAIRSALGSSFGRWTIGSLVKTFAPEEVIRHNQEQAPDFALEFLEVLKKALQNNVHGANETAHAFTEMYSIVKAAKPPKQ